MIKLHFNAKKKHLIINVGTEYNFQLYNRKNTFWLNFQKSSGSKEFAYI